MELHETKQIHARQGPLHDHDVVVCLFLPVQQFNYLRSAGALIGHECQANLQGEAFGMTRLKEKTWSFDGGSFPNKDFKTADKSFAVCD